MLSVTEHTVVIRTECFDLCQSTKRDVPVNVNATGRHCRITCDVVDLLNIDMCFYGRNENNSHETSIPCLTISQHQRTNWIDLLERCARHRPVD